MKIERIVACFALLISSSSAFSQSDWTFEQTFDSLQKEIAKRELYLDKRLGNIRKVERHLNASSDPIAQFDGNRTLYQMYYDLQIDSALKYARNMIALSEGSLSAVADYKTEAQIFIARSYAYQGMYHESKNILDSLYFDTELSNKLKLLFFSTEMELYKGLGDHTTIAVEAKQYRARVKMCIDSLLHYTPENSPWHAIYLSNKLSREDDRQGAMEILAKLCEKLTTDDREMAHAAFYLADLYRTKGDAEGEKRLLALSAITDVKFAVKEYVSLWKLARRLYAEGKVEIAHTFTEISLQDAIYSGAYRWHRQIMQILPDIYKAYNTKILKQRNEVISALATIAGLLVLTVLLSLFVIKQYSKLKRSNRELNEVSSKLHLANAELQMMNSQLLFLNNELVSTSLLKETYLSKFTDLCSDYIDKLDEYRVYLKRLLKEGKVELVRKELHSTRYVEQEIKEFLTNFDEMFLKLYPDFIVEFNSLLPEEERQEAKSTELLNTELRIFALIRLGITDSNHIARFLRCSIKTIYTYRSKIRNKSLCPDAFEERIKEYKKEDQMLSTLDQSR